jgi:pimeloyl-ACP methyl ester carboxylesterase
MWVQSLDGTAIAYDCVGHGSVIILVGGALTSRKHFEKLSQLLAVHCAVVSYDRRGRGDSADSAQYAVQREVEDIAALINTTSERVFLYGHSSGAALALEAANAFPSRIKKLALYEPPFIVNTNRPALPHDYVDHLNQLSATGRKGEAVEYFLMIGVGMPAGAVAELRQQPFWPGMEAMAHTLAYDGAIVQKNMRGQPLDAAQWSNVKMPTLVLSGTRSERFLQDGARAVSEVLHSAEYLELKGQDHGVAAEVLAPELVRFFGT